MNAMVGGFAAERKKHLSFGDDYFPGLAPYSAMVVGVTSGSAQQLLGNAFQVRRIL
jgi:hypothetical protein